MCSTLQTGFTGNTQLIYLIQMITIEQHAPDSPKCESICAGHHVKQVEMVGVCLRGQGGPDLQTLQWSSFALGLSRPSPGHLATITSNSAQWKFLTQPKLWEMPASISSGGKAGNPINLKGGPGVAQPRYKTELKSSLHKVRVKASMDQPFPIPVSSNFVNRIRKKLNHIQNVLLPRLLLLLVSVNFSSTDRTYR